MCLGPGTYVARADKASKFGANCSRHGGESGAVVKVRISFTRAKYVRYDDHSWISEGYDACRAERTSRSDHPEWCLKSPSQVKVLDVRPIACGAGLPAFEGEAMSLGAVRQIAASAGLAEVYFNEAVSVVSFATNAAVAESPRVNVYFSTGTVVDHPMQDRTALVRRKVDLHELQNICDELANRSHGSPCHCEPSRKGPTSVYHPESSHSANRHSAVGSEEEVVGAALKKLQEHVAVAEEVLKDHRLRREERERIEAAARKQEQERQAARQRQIEQEEAARLQQAAAAAAEAERQAKLRVQQARGTRQTYWIPKIWHEHTERNFDAATTCVALSDSTIMMLHENGGWSWYGTLTKLLDNKLQGRQRHLPGPTYVALSGDNRYYIEFADGKSEWVGPDSFSDKIHAESRGVRTVAFGKDWDAWFIVFDDGSWNHEGNIPDGLVQRLASRDRRGDLTCVSLGPSGEWYVSARNGRAWWGGLAEAQTDVVRPLADRITSMVFGGNLCAGNRYIHIRYE